MNIPPLIRRGRDMVRSSLKGKVDCIAFQSAGQLEHGTSLRSTSHWHLLALSLPGKRRVTFTILEFNRADSELQLEGRQDFRALTSKAIASCSPRLSSTPKVPH